MSATLKPLRFLMVIHTRWSRNLGAPRVQMELAEELKQLGDQVEKLSYEDVFPQATARGRSGRVASLGALLRSNLSFAARAKAWVRANAHRFDVIDANQTDLPVPKDALEFTGLLVARSVALIPVYHEFERKAARRWPEPFLRRWAYALLTLPGSLRRLRDVERSFRCADLINVSSSDDFATVSGAMGYGDKVIWLPFGMSSSRQEAFLRTRTGVRERLAARTVAFIGTWNSRKGARDWPLIARAVCAKVPDARFLLLGASIRAARVLSDFPPDLRGAVRVVESYESTDLPALLSGATVGAFPGYLEGFGFGVLEKLAAGLPTVTYDAPGPRDMMRQLDHPIMVPAGDVCGFAERLAAMLMLSPDRYAEHSEDSTRVASRFSWREIALRTRDAYLERSERLTRS